MFFFLRLRFGNPWEIRRFEVSDPSNFQLMLALDERYGFVGEELADGDALLAVLGELGPVAGDRGIEVVKEFRFRGRVLIDTNRMAQVIYNIAANARDAMPEGGTLLVGSGPQGDAEVALTIADTGVGLSAEARARLEWIADAYLPVSAPAASFCAS